MNTAWDFNFPSPKPPLRIALGLVGGAALLLLLIFVTEDSLFLFSPLLAFLLAVPSLFFWAAARARNAEPVLDPAQRLPRWKLVTVLAACLALAATPILLFPTLWSRENRRCKSTVTATNLRTVYAAAMIYYEQYGSFPSGLSALLDQNFIAPRTLLSPVDPDLADRHENYSSFDCPGMLGHEPDPRLPVCFERAPWSTLECRLFPTPCRMVLFGNGAVECLTEDEFAALPTPPLPSPPIPTPLDP